MAALKTQPNDTPIEDFLKAIEDQQQRADSFILLALMRELTGDEGKMWGDSIIGFGHYHYKYASGREGDWFQVGFSPRKGKLSLYLMIDLSQHAAKLAQLGKYKTGKSCLYVKRLADIDEQILRELIRQTIQSMTDNT